ncbi:MAG: HNH endonuclease [Anaerolineae bacterium]
MSRQSIPREVRVRVARDANHRCAYCQTSERVIGPLLEIDHIVPESKGGSSDESNLTLACPLCNSHKSDAIEAVDPATGQLAPLFNPRADHWSMHFEWTDRGAMIRGKTAVGRATVQALDLNHPDVVAARSLWASVGWHPPKVDGSVA